MITQPQRIKSIPLNNVEIKSGLWGERQATNRSRTIPAIYHNLEATGRLDAWYQKPGRVPPKQHKVVHMFWDSDTGKYIEAVAYSLHTHPDPELEKQTDEIINRIQQAQHEDGYLNTYFTVLETDKKWANLRDWHEMYNAGHLTEAAVAYYQATGKRTLLDVMMRKADLINSLFGPNEGQKRGYDGHPEIELALIRLYHTTGESRYLDLSRFFIEERGQEPHYFDIESRERGEDPADFWAKTYHYCQAHKPLREQTEATGHAVRACYLYAGMADIALETADDELVELSKTLWDDLTQHQMYITGGLGPAHSNEGFTFAFDLPNETAYAETCASIALVFWAQRMFQIDPNGKYIDEMERALYNNVLSGVSFKGDQFFYANPLASYPRVSPYEHWSGIHTPLHYRRQDWFYCPCCPPNLSRLVGSIGSYFYSQHGDTLHVHLYNSNRADLEINGKNVQLHQETNYPWDGEVKLTFQVEQPTEFDLALRIPGWCRQFSIQINGAAESVTPVNGYAHIRRQWANNDEVVLSLAMPVERMMPHPEIRHDAGQIALQRGPVIYCLEEVDNGSRLANVVIPPDAQLTAEWNPDLFGGVSVITGHAVRVEPADWKENLYEPQSVVQHTPTPQPFKAVPYCFWANREPGEMRVWIREA